MIYEKRSRKKGNTLSKSDFPNRAPREVENVCAMSAASSADEPRGPFLIILHPRHPHRARAALVIFSFFSFFFFIYSQRGDSLVQARDRESRLDYERGKRVERRSRKSEEEETGRKRKGERSGREKRAGRREG